jgi:hypothetical protein
VAPRLLGKLARAAENFTNRPLIAGILIISTAPLLAQAQQPDTAKLKADAQNVVSIIKGDKAKAQTYCQILNLGDELDDVDEQKDRKTILSGITGARCLGGR